MKKNWGGPSGALNRLQSHYFRALLKKLLEVIVHAPLAYLEFRYRIHYLFKCLKIVILLVREEVYFVGPCDVTCGWWVLSVLLMPLVWGRILSELTNVELIHQSQRSQHPWSWDDWSLA